MGKHIKVSSKRLKRIRVNSKALERVDPTYISPRVMGADRVEKGVPKSVLPAIGVGRVSGQLEQREGIEFRLSERVLRASGVPGR